MTTDNDVRRQTTTDDDRRDDDDDAGRQRPTFEHIEKLNKRHEIKNDEWRHGVT